MSPFLYRDQQIDIDGAADPDLNKIKGIIGHTNPDTHDADVLLFSDVTGSYIHVTNMTSGAGFILSGLFVTGDDTPIIGITNSKGTINLTDVRAGSASAVSGTLALNINNHNGAIILNRVSASESPVSGGALLANLLGTAGITITSSTFDHNGTGSSSGMFIASNGPVTINGSSFSDNRSPDLPGLSIFQSGTLTIKNTDISGNYHAGMLTEPLKSNITLENVYFLENHRTGVGLSTSGNITLKNVTASENYYQGALLDTCWVSAGACTATGTGKVSITSSIFDENENQNSLADAGALWIIARGAISLKDVTASQNGTVANPISGAILDTHYSPLTSGATIAKGTFDANLESGLLVYAKGAITLTSVSTVGNEYAYGAYLDNHFGTAGVTIKGSVYAYNYFSNNGDTLDANDDGLHIDTKGPLSLSYLYVQGNNGYGMLFVGSTGNVTIKNGNFSGNANTGLVLSTSGAITLNNVNANGNNMAGAILQNFTAPTPKNISITSSYFNLNDHEGLVIDTKGAVTITKTTASSSTASRGIDIDNRSGTSGVTISGSTMENNFAEGLYILSDGAIKLTNIISDSNLLGAFLTNASASTLQPVTINGGSFSGNDAYGLEISTRGNISLSKVKVIGNASYGAQMGNIFGAPAFPTIKVSNSNFDGNGAFGLRIRSRGAVTLTSITANVNAGIGADIENELGNVSVLGTNTNPNDFSLNTGTHDGLRINTTGAVILKTIYAIGNSGAWGVNIGFDKLPSSVSVVGANVHANQYGMVVISKGSITVSSVTGEANTLAALYLDNSNDHTGTKNIIISKGTFYGNAIGINVHSWGQITVSSSISSDNSGYGAILDNSANTLPVPKGITITGSTSLSNQFSDNTYSGIVAYSCGPITITGVTADRNGESGINLDESATPNHGGNITLSKITTRYNEGSGIYVDSNGTFKGSTIISLLNSTPGGWDGLTLYVHDHAVTISNSFFIGNGYYGLYVQMGAGSLAPLTLTNVFAAGNEISQIFVTR